jgi:1-deoxy-D-xylulose-5-phosphate reductoisomerase
MFSPRPVVVLGSTGSIGESAAKVARALPDQMKIVGISGYHNLPRLIELTQEFRPSAISTKEKTDADLLIESCATTSPAPLVVHGEEGLLTLATLPEAELIVIAIVGITGLKPALAALKAGKNLAIASKEILVMAGHEVMTTAQRYKRQVLPIDSEHNALFQCLEGRDPVTVRRLILTCSGGPFRKAEASHLAHVTPSMALRHPTWNMGSKITIDSATLFNKGLEMIEAHHLFGFPMEKIDVVIHPESIIHSMVEFVDGSLLAQMSRNDMMLPIQSAITYPQRIAGPCAPLNLAEIGALHFEKPRHDLFPALQLAREAGTRGGTMPAILNAANEKAVELFLEEKISFPSIWNYVATVMQQLPSIPTPTLEEIIEADHAARNAVLQLYKRG